MTLPPYISNLAPERLQAFDEFSIVALPGPPPAAEIVLLTLNVPNGWQCFISEIAHGVTGAGFTDGSGDLVWRITRNSRPIPSFGRMLVHYGSFEQSREEFLFAKSKDKIEYRITNVNLGGAGFFSWANLKGVFYQPEQKR